MSSRARYITIALALTAGIVTLVFAPRPAAAASDVTGRWTGSFEFVVAGERAVFGPAASMQGKRRGDDDRAPTFGEGDLTLVVENQLDDHFFGRWNANGREGDIVCTMMDESRFLCGGRQANVVGSVLADDQLRMCWSVSGKNPTTGCADLTRPN